MIRIGIIGLGAAGEAFAGPMSRHEKVRLSAVCDLRADVRAEAAERFGVPVFDAIGDMLSGVDLDAVYVGTPTELHRPHAMQSIEAGLHVLLEKPMTVRPEDARAMARAAEARGLVLTVGHSHSHDAPVRAMREVVTSGRLGRVRMLHNLCYSDWVYRPRRPEELRPELGGGVTFRQGAHQFDILRALADDEVEAVSATLFDWDPARPTIGAHVVTLRFAGGAVGTAIYNGYGRFRSHELTGMIGEWGFPGRAGEAPPRPSGDEEAELERKRARAKGAIRNDAPHQPHFGLTLVSCEGGDIRQSPDGLLVYDADGCEEIRLPENRSPRDLVLDEFFEAVAGRPALHDGWWGASVVEICAAAHESSATGRPVPLGSARGPEALMG